MALAVVLVTQSAVADRDTATTTATYVPILSLPCFSSECAFRIFFCASAGADIAISIALLWQFSRVNTIFDHTKSLMRRLIGNTIRSGAATSFVALLGFTLFMVGKQQNWATGVVFVEARVYNLTMLYNLNLRKSVGGAGRSTGRQTSDIEMENDASRRRPMQTDTVGMSGIHVIRTVNIHGDVCLRKSWPIRSSDTVCCYRLGPRFPRPSRSMMRTKPLSKTGRDRLFEPYRRYRGCFRSAALLSLCL